MPALCPRPAIQHCSGHTARPGHAPAPWPHRPPCPHTRPLATPPALATHPRPGHIRYAPVTYRVPMTDSAPTVTLPGGTELPAIGQGTWYMGDDPDRRAEEVAALRAGVEDRKSTRLNSSHVSISYAV